MDKINVYEYSGIICPGAVFIIGLCLIFPEIRHGITDFNLGELGLFVILSFCLGHIIQGTANILEDITGCPKRLSKKRLAKLKINKTYQEIYSKINQKGSTERINIFNRQYGLMRGLFMNFLLLLTFAAIFGYGFEYYKFYIVGVILAIICLYRAHHCSELYFKELIAEYKNITKH